MSWSIGCNKLLETHIIDTLPNEGRISPNGGGEGEGGWGYHWIELVEWYLEHYLSQLEHLTGRIAGEITRIRRQLHLRHLMETID